MVLHIFFYTRAVVNVKLVLSRVKSLILLLAPSLPADFACFLTTAVFLSKLIRTDILSSGLILVKTVWN